jgi:hypothetical protein
MFLFSRRQSSRKYFAESAPYQCRVESHRITELNQRTLRRIDQAEMIFSSAVEKNIPYSEAL